MNFVRHARAATAGPSAPCLPPPSRTGQTRVRQVLRPGTSRSDRTFAIRRDALEGRPVTSTDDRSRKPASGVAAPPTGRAEPEAGARPAADGANASGDD